MLTLLGPRNQGRYCDRISRRGFLQIGGLALGGLSLTDVLRAEASTGSRSNKSVIMIFLLASFPAGLVIYWTWNNLLSVGQQYLMMRRQGVPVHLVENMKMPAWLTALKLKATGTKKPIEGPGE